MKLAHARATGRKIDSWELHKDYWNTRVAIEPPDCVLKPLYKDPILRMLLAWRTLGRYGLSPLMVAGLLGRTQIAYTLKQLKENPEDYAALWCGDTGLNVWKPVSVMMSHDMSGHSFLYLAQNRSRSGDNDPWTLDAVKLSHDIQKKAGDLSKFTDHKLRTWHIPNKSGQIEAGNWAILKGSVEVGEINGKVETWTGPRGSART